MKGPNGRTNPFSLLQPPPSTLYTVFLSLRIILNGPIRGPCALRSTKGEGSSARKEDVPSVRTKDLRADYRSGANLDGCGRLRRRWWWRRRGRPSTVGC